MIYRSLFACLWFLLPGCWLIACTGSSDKPADTTAAAPRDSVVVTLLCEDSISVLGLLQQAHQVEFRSSAMGAFVTSIDSVAGGGDAFWLYSVNDTMVPLAADRMIVQPGDTVRWHLRLPGT